MELRKGVYRTFQSLESLINESGLRKPYKALVLEMEPYKMKKLFRQVTKKMLLSYKLFFINRQHFFCGATTFIFDEQQHFLSSDKKNWSLEPYKCKHCDITEP